MQITTPLDICKKIVAINLIDQVYKLGICSFYYQVLELIKCLSIGIKNQYHCDSIFCSSKLKMLIVRELSKGNRNFNTTSSASSMHYYGTNITIKQYQAKDKQRDKFFS